MTICWHVDDLNISHREEEVVSAFAVEMAAEFGLKAIMSRGKVHNYLGMALYFGTCPSTMIISMIKYLQKIINNFPEVLRGTTACPATNNSFKVRKDKDKELLSENIAKQFYRTTAQLLFLCKRARPDVETLVSFLTIMAKQPDKDD